MDPCAIRKWKLDIGTELLSRTGASQLDTDPCAIWTRRLVGQYSGSSKVSRLLQTSVSESKKLKPVFIEGIYRESDSV